MKKILLTITLVIAPIIMFWIADIAESYKYYHLTEALIKTGMIGIPIIGFCAVVSSVAKYMDNQK